MRLDMNAFPKHTYMGSTKKNSPYTKGEEYYRVEVGNSFYRNVLGVYMTSDEYVGDDIDYCVFFDMDTFNKFFTPDIPSLLFPSRGVRRHHRYRTRKKMKNIVRSKHGKAYVENEFRERNQGKIYNFSFKCTCYSCQMTQGKRTEKRLEEMRHRMREYREEDLSLSDAG